MKIEWGAQKGKAYGKLPGKTLEVFNRRKYMVSTKFDGNQIFIAKQGTHVRWFTSDWKEFNLPQLSISIANLPIDFVMMGEFNYDRPGKKGDRTLAQGKLTTERVNFNKKIKCTLDESKVVINIFDIMEFDSHGYRENRIYSARVSTLVGLCELLPRTINAVEFQYLSGEEAWVYAKELDEAGWEGCMCMEPDQFYHVNKRVNHSIKLKIRPTADLECIEVTDGEDKYEGMIGALVLKDKQGRIVKVGSGLNDEQRGYHEDYFIGQIIEIEYEQILATYQQPVFIRIRDDKFKGE